jgi:hypothetical protein
VNLFLFLLDPSGMNALEISTNVKNEDEEKQICRLFGIEAKENYSFRPAIMERTKKNDHIRP